VSKSEEFIDSAKRAILKAKWEIENRFASTGKRVNPAEESSASATPRPSLAHPVKLSPIKLETLAGAVEFYFMTSISADPKTRISKCYLIF
jgi:hypothetical protein